MEREKLLQKHRYLPLNGKRETFAKIQIPCTEWKERNFCENTDTFQLNGKRETFAKIQIPFN